MLITSACVLIQFTSCCIELVSFLKFLSLARRAVILQDTHPILKGKLRCSPLYFDSKLICPLYMIACHSTH